MKLAVAVFFLCMLIGSGCSTESNPSVSTETTSTSVGEQSDTISPQPPAYDPPRQFASEPVPVGNGRVAVADGVAYSYSDTGLVATDVATGSQRWSVSLPGAFNLVTGPMSKGYSPGVVPDDAGQKLVVAAYYGTAEGTGTQQDSDFTQVVAVDTAGEVRWEVTVQPATTTPRVVGGFDDDRGAAVVLDAIDTVVLDMASGGVRWTGPRVTPTGVDGDKVIGLRAAESSADPWTTVALRGSDGGQIWAGPVLEGGTAVVFEPPALSLAGPGRAIVSGQNDTFDVKTIVIDTSTGAEVASIPEFLQCQFDERDTAVCYDTAPAGELSKLVVGLDVTTGQQLWKLPDEAAKRTALNVTAVYHGAVYGDANRSAVILDARTGAELVSDAGIAPTQVFPGYGVVTSVGDDRSTVAYQATG